MLTVWSVCTGSKYHPAYVYALRDAVADNLTVPHRFLCLTDAPEKFPGIDCVTLPKDYGGWWNKLHLFNLARSPSIYFDLDVVITGNLNYLQEYTARSFAAPSNWAQSGHGGVQSSVMCWSGELVEVYRKFQRDPVQYVRRLWGDQEYLTETIDPHRWTHLPWICSYKYHVRGYGIVPDEVRVVVFHGKPDPHEVNDECLLRYTSTLRSRIKSNTVNESTEDSYATA